MASKKSNIDETQDHSLASESDIEEIILEDVVPKHANEADSGEESAEQQLAKAQLTINDYWDQMMRLRAEIENNRKRAERDIENAHKYALKNFVESLLPIIDSLEMGQTAAETENATLESIREGSALTMNMFAQMLEKQGLEQINPLGEVFDPERHQAISMIEDKKAASNTVIEVMQKGFVLNDRLVRPAMVVVAK